MEEHSTSLVSSFGHIFVCLPGNKIQTTSDFLGSNALNFGANTGPLGKGPWIGEYQILPFHDMVRKNRSFQGRALTIFELEVSPSELQTLREDLAARLTEDFPYDFRRLNCGHYLWEWLSGEGTVDAEFLYLTPREALEKIFTEHPPIRVRILRTDQALLEDYLSSFSSSTQSLASEVFETPQALLEISDLVLRLLLIKVAESTADSEDFRLLQSIRKMTLESNGGKEAAKRLVDIQERAWREELSEWQSSPQGPAFSMGSFIQIGSREAGIKVNLEAGLHGFQESSSSRHSTKEVRFLAGVLQQSESATRADFTLISLNNLRAFGPLRRSASNGFNLGYSGLPNSLGLEDLFVSAWTGVSFNQPGRWLGGRITLAASDIADRNKILAIPGILFRQEVGNSTFSTRLDYRVNEGPGWLLKQSLRLTDSSTLNFEWIESPLNEGQLSIAVELRF